MAEMRTRRLDVSGLGVHCVSAGEGEPVLLLHGLGASSYSWRFLTPRLAGDFQVHAIDWPGHGRSDKPLDFDYSPAGYSRLLLGVMDALGLARADLVGNSMGGLLALWTALDRPERVRRLVLIGSPLYPRDIPVVLSPLRWPVLGCLFERCLGRWMVELIARGTYVNRAVVTEELIDEYAAVVRCAGGRRAVGEFMRNAVPADPEAYTRRYSSLPHPALVIWGDRDAVVRRESVERFAREAPKGRLAHLPGAGHAPQEDQPEDVLRLVGPFLKP